MRAGNDEQVAALPATPTAEDARVQHDEIDEARAVPAAEAASGEPAAAWGDVRLCLHMNLHASRRGARRWPVMPVGRRAESPSFSRRGPVLGVSGLRGGQARSFG